MAAHQEKTAEFETADPESTLLLGERLARLLKPGAVVAFYGDLGAGKTTMIKGFARGLGVTETVKSPSFVIITEYQGRVPVYHIDLYRIRSTEELVEIDLDTYLQSDGISFIEWAERAEGLLPEKTIRIKLTVLPRGRRIEITGLDRRFIEELN